MRTIFLWLCLPLLAPGCVTADRIKRAQSKVDLGVAYYREGNTEAAIEKLREATQTDPRNWRAFNTLGITYAAKGEPELAGEAFERALKINPGEGEILVNYGSWQLVSGDADGAVSSFERALEDLDYRNTAIVLSNLSFALLKAGRTAEAVERAREATRRMPTLCQAWLHLGLADEAAGDTQGALATYDHLIAECPNELVAARVRVGCIEVRGASPEEGVATLQGVMQAVPNTGLADEARACLSAAGR